MRGEALRNWVSKEKLPLHFKSIQKTGRFPILLKGKWTSLHQFLFFPSDFFCAPKNESHEYLPIIGSLMRFFFLKRFFRFYWVWDIFGGEMITCVCHDEVESWSCSLVFEQRSLLMSWHSSEGTLSTWNGVKKRSAIISVIPTSLWTTYFAMHCVTRHRRAFVDSYRYLSHILYL